eukprot:3333880-Pleurochrysis_carterae.AAC.1
MPGRVEIVLETKESKDEAKRRAVRAEDCPRICFRKSSIFIAAQLLRIAIIIGAEVLILLCGSGLSCSGRRWQWGLGRLPGWRGHSDCRWLEAAERNTRNARPAAAV